jgi:hypothetical protein
MDKLVKKDVDATLATKKKAEAFFKSFSAEVATAIEKGTVGYVWEPLKSWFEGFKRLEGLAKDALKKQVQHYGTPTNDKGSKKLRLEGGLVIPLVARKPEWDDKRVEALLRSKGLDPDKYMQVEKRYKTDAALLEPLIGPKLSLDELKACRGQATYALMPAKYENDGDEVVDADE